MNTPKTFEPVVTMPEPVAYLFDIRHDASGDGDQMLSFMRSHVGTLYGGWTQDGDPEPLYTAAQLRAYAAEVARAMVPAEVARSERDSDVDWGYFLGHGTCRAATLSAIDEWEKNV